MVMFGYWLHLTIVQTPAKSLQNSITVQPTPNNKTVNQVVEQVKK